MHEPGSVGLLAAAFDKEMNMIRHETVHIDVEGEFACSTQNLIENQIHCVMRHEVTPTPARAKGQEITLQADIAGGIESRPLRTHTFRRAKREGANGTAGLKACATDDTESRLWGREGDRFQRRGFVR